MAKFFAKVMLEERSKKEQTTVFTSLMKLWHSLEKSDSFIQ